MTQYSELITLPISGIKSTLGLISLFSGRSWKIPAIIPSWFYPGSKYTQIDK